MRACVMRALKPQWSEALTLLACSKATLLCWSVLAHLGLTSQQVADLQLLLPLLNLLNSYQHCRGIADHQGTDVNQVVLVYILAAFRSMCSALRPPMPCKSLPCWQTKATLQGEHMLLTSINHSTLGCLSKVIYCRLRCTFVTVVALAENTQHILGVFRTTRCNALVRIHAVLHSAALSTY